MATTNTPQPPRSGFTLLEMLIVVAVVVAIATLGWPSVRKLSHRSSLKDAARQLRVVLARTRLEAIETGQMRQFRYLPGTGQYEVSAGQYEVTSGWGPQDQTAIPLVPPDADLEQALSTPGDLASPADSPQQLPHDVCFADPEFKDLSQTGEEPAELLSTMGWSQPILFFPNGRTSRARIALAFPPRYHMEVIVRGLTGAVKLGKVELMKSPLNEPVQPVAGDLR